MIENVNVISKLPSYKDYEELYEIDSSTYEDSVEERIERLRDKQIIKYRTKTIKSGDMLECEIYPIWRVGGGGKREKKAKDTRAAQNNLNNKNAVKHLIRIVNTNFTKKDIWLTLTYSDGRLPTDVEQAKKDMQNYIRRVKRHMKKLELGELKYVYVTEFDDTTKGKVRIHHHIIMNFNDRDMAEQLWSGGGRTQARRLQPNDFGLEGLARYITKQRKGANTKRYTISRNMKQPKVTIADSKITRRKAEKIATEENIAHEIFQKMYKGYKFNDLTVKYSQFVSGAYLYVRMKRIEDSPIEQKRRNDE